MAERGTAIGDGCQRTRDTAGPDPDHAPDRDRRTINVVGLARNLVPGPGKGKGGKTTHNNRLSPPETRWSHGPKTRKDAGLGPAREREGKKKGSHHHHPGVLRKLQGPVFRPQKTQNSHRTREKIKMSLEAPSKRKVLLRRINKKLPPVLLRLKIERKTRRQTARLRRQR